MAEDNAQLLYIAWCKLNDEAARELAEATEALHAAAAAHAAAMCKVALVEKARPPIPSVLLPPYLR
jgi:hypothetical protein